MTTSTDQLIVRLGTELTPVRRLAAPSWRALAWLALVAALATFLASRADLPALSRRFAAEPGLALAALGSTLTAILAAISAFQLSLPDRPRSWALLPLPALGLWLVCSGLGCLRPVLIAGLHPATLRTAMSECLPFIVGLSLPLSFVLVLMLRRARPLEPGFVAAMGGLAAAAAAASLLCLDHPFEASAADLLTHIAAVLIAITVIRWGGARLL